MTYSNNKASNNAIELPLVYFYGYTAVTEEGEKLAVSPSKHGWLQVEINDREAGALAVEYTGTAIQRVSKWVSLVSLAGYVALSVISRRELKGELTKETDASSK